MTAADLTFDVPTHAYRRPDGVRVPSVTEILKRTGVSVDFDALPNKDAIARKRDIGTALHADIHAFDDNDLDVSAVHPEVRPYVDAWAEFRRVKGLVPQARERRIYHPSLGYAGTLDGIFTDPGCDVEVLIDVKTGDPESAAARYQTAGYLLAHAVEHPDAMGMRRWSVQLVPGRRIPFIVTPYTDWQDFSVWQAIVTTFHAQTRRSAA